MISYEQIGTLLRTRLTELPNRPPTLWDNQEKDPVKFPDPPLFIVQMIRDEPFRVSHRGGHILTGEMQVSILLNENKYTAVAERWADQLTQHFPAGLRLGPVEITARANVLTGYSDPPYWRLPVKIPWRVLD